MEHVIRAASKLLIVRAGQCTCLKEPYKGPVEVVATIAALTPGRASVQKLNVALYSLSLSMWGHCLHSVTSSCALGLKFMLYSLNLHC